MQEQLTSREKEIFNLLLEGNSLKEIAYNLKIAYSTVDYHRAKLYRKLGVNSIKELFAKYSTFNTKNVSNTPVEPLPVCQTKKRTLSGLLLPAGIALLAVSVLSVLYFVNKPSKTQSDENPIVITLSDNYPLNHNYQYYPPVLYNSKITEGDIFTVTYTFTSNIDFNGWLMIMLLDSTVEADKFDTPLSEVTNIAGNVKANTEYSGLVTIIANKTASSIAVNANRFDFAVSPYTPTQPPTLTFSRLEIVRNN